MELGSIVEAQGDSDEQMVGIIIGTDTDLVPPFLVLWVSNLRGIFTSQEVPNDIFLAPLTHRPSVGNDKIIHLDLARCLGSMVGQ